MSSILRALKKLENDPRHLEEPGTLESKFVPLADTRQQKKSAGLIIMLLGAGIACGLVILGGWWLLSGKNMQQPTAPQQMSRQNLQKTEAPSVGPGKSVARQVTEPAAGSDISRDPVKPSADIVASKESRAHIIEPTPIILPQPSTRTIEQKTVLPLAEQMVSSSRLLPVTKNAEAVLPAAEIISSEVPLKKVEIPLLNDPEMKLQAITWSKDPQKRLAVINNSILRQGEAVSGYRIDAINQDDVVLNDRGKKWKIIFRIR